MLSSQSYLLKFYKHHRKNKVRDTCHAAYLTHDVPSIQKLMSFSDEDYLISLYQATYVLSSYNNLSNSLNPSLSCWFVLGFYGYIFELACKGLVSYTNTLSGKLYSKCGECANLLVKKYTKLDQLALYFDHYLRNAIDHSQYVITDLEKGKIEAWNVRKAIKTEKRPYDIPAIFRKSARLLLFVIALHASFYEAMERLVVE